MKKTPLYFRFAEGVELFSTMKDTELPYVVIQSHQIHSNRIAIITDPTVTRDQLQGIDALITNLRGCAIGARTADCVPVLLYDTNHKVIASIHSGWKGTVLKIVQCTITKMNDVFGTMPIDIKAFIGPSISADCFQVGSEVVDAFSQSGFPMKRILKDMGIKEQDNIYSGIHIDLWEANKWLLEDAGVLPQNIEVARICTYQNELFPSARRERNNKCERIINSIKLI